MIEQLAYIFSDGNWDELKPAQRAHLRMQARAGVQAMREPTREMSAAGITAFFEKVAEEGALIGAVAVKEIWQAMIDEALKE